MYRASALKMEMPFMTRKFALLLIAATLPFTGCDKIKALIHRQKPATPAPVGAAVTPASSQPNQQASQPSSPPSAQTSAAPAPSTAKAGEPQAPTRKPSPLVNKTAAVIALCYHNIEDSGKMKALTIPTAEFEKEMQAIKDNGFTVIPMQDFLAWRRGEKAIPAKCALISLDDGWISAYNNAWPILKKYHYPFTLFIYINYVGTGGKSMSWDQLAEMRDAGVDIESHTYSHSNLRVPGGDVDAKARAGIKKDVAALGLDGWLRKEIIGSKEVLENKLGIKVNAFAYPYGKYSPKALEMVKEAGYEAAFTVYGQLLTWSAPFDRLGRYAVEASKPQIFADAMKMIGGGVVASSSQEPAYQELAAASMITQPMDGESIKDPKPMIRANLATLGNLDPKSVEMRISGFGVVPAKYDPTSKTIEFQVAKPLMENDYTVFISGVADGKKIETKWSFTYGTKQAPAATPEPAATPKGKKKH
jgi:peptidoglycan/xylan/chitin deacetylase (PgdA/CDA1 family)